MYLGNEKIKYKVIKAKYLTNGFKTDKAIGAITFT